MWMYSFTLSTSALPSICDEHANLSFLIFLQTLLQDCLAPVAGDVCAEITKSAGAANTPLQKIIK